MLKHTVLEKLNSVRPELKNLPKGKQELSDKKRESYVSLLMTKSPMIKKDELINIIESEKVETVLQEEKLEELQPLDKNMIEYVCNFIPQSAKMWKDVDLETKGID